ncbi:hypothetical protein HPS57_03650 [Prevotella sp. PINT]|uniref:tetratricopeptide repeat protein n=1 Tax=Palleniella intestinalis TaxID=2736291 RepID=UPI001551720E|nr:hypothetical protein [Palleniella intestinalis]NPD81070.1 hypothetical protein [Palleniella intestinalis]
MDKVNPKELAYYYTTLGEVHKDSDPELAKAYFIKALQYRNLPKTYKFLADLYLKEGDSKKAKELWKKASEAKSYPLKIAALTALQELQEKENDYKEATKTAKWIIALKDSAQQKKEEEQVLLLQSKYDSELTESQKDSHNLQIIIILAGIAIMLCGCAVYYRVMTLRKHKELDGNNEEMARNMERISALEEAEKESSKEMAILKKENDILNNRQSEMVRKGKCLYDSVMHGESISLWERDDYTCFLEYYRSLDMGFVRNLENNYDRLSLRQKVFMILCDMKDSDDEIAQIMGIEITSLRSMRTRTKQRAIGENLSFTHRG